MRYYYYYSYGKRPGPFATFLTILGGVVFLVAFFFLALPIFLAALVVFSGIALYVGWRMKRALKRMEEEMEKEMRMMEEKGDTCGIIDIEKEPID